MGECAASGPEGRRLRGLASDPLDNARTGRRLRPLAFRRGLAGRLVGLRQRRRGRVIEQPQLRRRHRRREVRIQPRLVDVVEKREQRVKILLRKGVELVIVAAAALEREAEEGGAERRHPVVDVVDAILLLDGAAFTLLLVESVEGRGQHLLVGGVRQEVAGHLPERELVPRQVVVERPDHPVAPRPHVGPRPIDLETVAIGIAGQIHPVARHPLAIPRTREQSVEEFFICIGRRISHERLDLPRRRRQAGDVERRPADERAAIGLGLERQAPRGEPSPDDRVDRAGASGDRRQFRLHRRHECPVRLVCRPFGDPPLQRLDLFVQEPADLGMRRRHDGIGIV